MYVSCGDGMSMGLLFTGIRFKIQFIDVAFYLYSLENMRIVLCAGYKNGLANYQRRGNLYVLKTTIYKIAND